MIAQLRGTIASRGDDWAVVDVGGVGYLCSCSGRTLTRLPVDGETVTLVVETQVREESIQLFGFIDATERDWFRLLITVQGVGGRVALALLSAWSPEQLATAIAAEDRAVLTRATGVGAKLAARLVTELKDKVASLSTQIHRSTPAAPTSLGQAVTEPGLEATLSDATSALVNLGYGRGEAFAAVSRASRDGGTDVQGLVRAALKEFARATGG